MALGDKFLQRKMRSKQSISTIKSQISLGNVRDGILPLLHTLQLIKPRDEVISIDFDWHNIKDDVCPITINLKKGATVKTTD